MTSNNTAAVNSLAKFVHSAYLYTVHTFLTYKPPWLLLSLKLTRWKGIIMLNLLIQ